MKHLAILLSISLLVFACSDKTNNTKKIHNHAENLQNQVLSVKTELANYRKRRSEAPRILPKDFSEVTAEERALMDEQKFQFEAEKQTMVLNLYMIRDETQIHISQAKEHEEETELQELENIVSEIDMLIKELDPEGKVTYNAH